MTTDDGITGWGTGCRRKGGYGQNRCGGDERLPYRERTGNIEDLWQTLYGAVSIGAVRSDKRNIGNEQALWDIKGKLGVPVYTTLLGGAVRDKLKVYCWIGGDKPSNVVAEARGKIAAGYTALKMNGTDEMNWIDSYSKIDAAVERLAAIRDEMVMG